VLEDKAFSRLGGTDDRIIDARVVAATNADVWQKVREGNFRKDLFYRLKVVQIEVPPLRQRKDDIPMLTHFFMNKYCFEYKKELFEVPGNIEDIFMAYRWPGNVRELENLVRRAIVLRDWSFIFNDLNLDNLDAQGHGQPLSDLQLTMLHWHDGRLAKIFEENDFSLKKICKAFVSEVERQAILKALRDTQWNRKKASEQLCVSYKTLLNRIEEFNLTP
jgi:two-component system response regulator AtoC